MIDSRSGQQRSACSVGLWPRSSRPPSRSTGGYHSVRSLACGPLEEAALSWPHSAETGARQASTEHTEQANESFIRPRKRSERTSDSTPCDEPPAIPSTSSLSWKRPPAFSLWLGLIPAPLSSVPGAKGPILAFAFSINARRSSMAFSATMCGEFLSSCERQTKVNMNGLQIRSKRSCSL